MKSSNYESLSQSDKAFSYVVSKEESEKAWEYACNLVKYRELEKISKGSTPNIGKNKKIRELKERHFKGKMGEIATKGISKKYFGFDIGPVHYEYCQTGGDNYDFNPNGHLIDIKTIFSHCNHLQVPVSEQKRKIEKGFTPEFYMCLKAPNYYDRKKKIWKFTREFYLSGYCVSQAMSTFFEGTELKKKGELIPGKNPKKKTYHEDFLVRPIELLETDYESLFRYLNE